MKKDSLYLSHIYEESEFILETIDSMTRSKFLESRIIQKAVIQSLGVIGEAAKQISPDFREAHPYIDWKGMSGLRDRLIHGYFVINLSQVWEVISDDIPLLHDQLYKILKE
ncbi:DUF86 domain-containing protein [Methanoplanus sp. FWC-SCC4]|uniref:DUF86 domain-containing protein n=1 Tax=Methanochimaera problematica TaxID=2609417 RepID=A0AA97FEZ5_9EURY|nr:DUF86 domain-containing protein [Methanoplanus sp. FWC-SCC4]WOF17058.1 DUF86 domain-containing protein [Methanoplanus sp. FWC-SCC4]